MIHQKVFYFILEIVSEYDQEIPQLLIADNLEEEPHNKYDALERQTSKTTSSLFPIKMIAKLEWTQSNAQQNIEQLENRTMGVTFNNESTTT